MYISSLVNYHCLTSSVQRSLWATGVSYNSKFLRALSTRKWSSPPAGGISPAGRAGFSGLSGGLTPAATSEQPSTKQSNTDFQFTQQTYFHIHCLQKVTHSLRTQWLGVVNRCWTIFSEKFKIQDKLVPYVDNYNLDFAEKRKRGTEELYSHIIRHVIATIKKR